MFKPLGMLIVILAPQIATAQQAQPCDWEASVQSLAEPWAENTRLFANGDVRLALLDTLEPAAAAFRLLILSPPFDELGDRQCITVGHGSAGFSGMMFDQLTSDYDPARGLIFDIPVQVMGTGDVLFEDRHLQVTLNQANGDVSAAFK
ncbi:hypothetical protein [Aestuariibius sp. HNIBRBA575]|uniref:hypothetical protein n=1 Tax=Aestuariibius sp. HNIBRBA575 TaxID=3233343 RepID=UPI0034A2A549